MSKLPSYKRIYEQDYPPENQQLVSILANTINSGFEPLYEVLNGKLTFTDNTASLIKEITVEVDANGKPKSKTIIKKTGTDKFQGFMVIRATNLTNSGVYPTGGVFVSYTETTDTVVINHIAGLPANYVFLLNLFGIR